MAGIAAAAAAAITTAATVDAIMASAATTAANIKNESEAKQATSEAETATNISKEQGGLLEAAASRS